MIDHGRYIVDHDEVGRRQQCSKEAAATRMNESNNIAQRKNVNVYRSHNRLNTPPLHAKKSTWTRISFLFCLLAEQSWADVVPLLSHTQQKQQQQRQQIQDMTIDGFWNCSSSSSNVFPCFLLFLLLLTTSIKTSLRLPLSTPFLFKSIYPHKTTEFTHTPHETETK